MFELKKNRFKQILLLQSMLRDKYISLNLFILRLKTLPMEIALLSRVQILIVLNLMKCELIFVRVMFIETVMEFLIVTDVQIVLK